jgi:hypothetical protein
MGPATGVDHCRDGEGLWDYWQSAWARIVEPNPGRPRNESTIFGSRYMADSRVGAHTTTDGKKPRNVLVAVYSKMFIVKMNMNAI